MNYKRKYAQDFKRCAGTNCSVKDKCARHEAIVEARDNGCAFGSYLEAGDCIKNECSEFIVIEAEVSE